MYFLSVTTSPCVLEPRWITLYYLQTCASKEEVEQDTHMPDVERKPVCAWPGHTFQEVLITGAVPRWATCQVSVSQTSQTSRSCSNLHTWFFQKVHNWWIGIICLFEYILALAHCKFAYNSLCRLLHCTLSHQLSCNKPCFHHKRGNFSLLKQVICKSFHYDDGNLSQRGPRIIDLQFLSFSPCFQWLFIFHNQLSFPLSNPSCNE